MQPISRSRQNRCWLAVFVAALVSSGNGLCQDGSSVLRTQASTPAMVPINPGPGVLPPTTAVGPTFDPYATTNAPSLLQPGPGFPSTSPAAPYNTSVPPAGYSGAANVPPSLPASGFPQGGTVSPPPAALPSTSPALPPSSVAPGTYPPAAYGSTPYPGAPYSGAAGSYPGTYPGGYPNYGGASPLMPGTGQSGVTGTFPYTGAPQSQPGVYPSSPSSLFPGSSQPTGIFGGLFDGWFGSQYPYGQNPYALPPAPYQNAPPNTGYGAQPGYNWNPQGSVFQSPIVGGSGAYPEFVRFFQGARLRHAYVNGNNDTDALMINDTDFAMAFAWPNFLFSTQPLYMMPSFSLHQWDGPKAVDADLPALAYSAFLDLGWESDPARILGAELGLRVGMFTDFNTSISDSLRVLGRGIGRIRLTPRATLKLGVLYLDRVKVKLLPAGGLLWQPNPDTRFDLFFPEPKLSHYLSTVGNSDTWWYVAGYYGGGSWTVERAGGGKESMDINDLRLVFGLEWGRNEQIREGRRRGFMEIGYVFDREVRYKVSTMDNMDFQDTIMFRLGFGY